MLPMIKREDDWCFICESRKSKLIAINFKVETEDKKSRYQFIRICLDCLKRSIKIIEDNKIHVNEDLLK
jgi:hypothetical protein